jgi:predicted Fe-Mo cluster-binding NifX family protein
MIDFSLLAFFGIYLAVGKLMDMKIAIPLFGTRISPRFDFSPEIRIITVEDGKVVCQENFPVAHLNLTQRLDQLASNGVNKMICGGIDGFSRDQLGSRGIGVIQDVIGDAEIVIDLFMEGRLRPGLCCERRGGRQFCGWGKGSGRREI